MKDMALNPPNACQIDCSVVQLPPIEYSTRPTVLQRAGQIDEAINNMWHCMRDRREGEKESEARWKSLSLELLADKALVSRMGMGRDLECSSQEISPQVKRRENFTVQCEDHKVHGVRRSLDCSEGSAVVHEALYTKKDELVRSKDAVGDAIGHEVQVSQIKRMHGEVTQSEGARATQCEGENVYADSQSTDTASGGGRAEKETLGIGVKVEEEAWEEELTCADKSFVEAVPAHSLIHGRSSTSIGLEVRSEIEKKKQVEEDSEEALADGMKSTLVGVRSLRQIVSGDRRRLQVTNQQYNTLACSITV
jgi:hypothetical protein